MLSFTLTLRRFYRLGPLLVLRAVANKAPNARLVTGDTICIEPGSGLNAHCVPMAPDAFTFGVTSDIANGVGRCTERRVIDDQLAGARLCQFYDGQSTTIYCHNQDHYVNVTFTAGDAFVTYQQGLIDFAWQNAAKSDSAHSYVSDDVLSITCLTTFS